MRVVIDCYIIVAAARIDGSCRAALLAAIRDHEIVLSDPIVDEYRDVGARQKHRAYRPIMLILIDLLDIVALTVEPTATTFGLQDPGDQAYLATASASDAQVLIIGNLRHFSKRFRRGIEILTPSEVLERP